MPPLTALTDRPSWSNYFLDIAEVVSTRSACTRRQVGAVLVLENRIISTGYNGMEPGHKECLEGGCPRGQQTYQQVGHLEPTYDQPGATFCPAIHAEVNAVLGYVGYRTIGLSKAHMYINCNPCDACADFMSRLTLDWTARA
jgi:dCMP deaminase